MREQDIIRRYFSYCGGEGVRLSVGDDAAILAPPAGDMVMSTDTLNAGVHFFDDVTPYLLARKAAAVSLSDIAAMGGRALWLTVALTAPAHTGSDWFEQFAQGLASSTRDYNYAVVGGDLTRGTQLSVTTTAIGTCSHPPHTRSAARIGDDIWLSGTVGGAAHAVAVRLGTLPPADDMTPAEHALHNPTPRLPLAAALACSIHAMMDISDGLATTAQTIADQSQVGIQLDTAALPLAPTLQALPVEARRHCQFCGGDDYELLFTAPAAAAARLQTLATSDIPLTRIGSVVSGSGVHLHHRGTPIAPLSSGYSHDFN